MLLPILIVSILEPLRGTEQLLHQLARSISSAVRHAFGTACREAQPSPGKYPAQECPVNHCWRRTLKHLLHGITSVRWETYPVSIENATLTQISRDSECSRSLLCRPGANSMGLKAPTAPRSLLVRTLLRMRDLEYSASPIKYKQRLSCKCGYFFPLLM